MAEKVRIVILVFTLSTTLLCEIVDAFSVGRARSRVMVPSLLSSTSKSDITDDNSAESSSVKGIIWDIDGTLADSWKLGYDATAEVLKRNGIPDITPEIYHECTRYATPERLARHAGLTPPSSGKIDENEEFFTVGAKLGKEFDDLYIGLVDTTTAGFFPGIMEMFTKVLLPMTEKQQQSNQQGECSTIALGALTNACVDYGHAALKANFGGAQSDGYRAFSSIRGADNVPKPKPEPDGLFEVCKDMNVSPGDCVYVGDSPSDAGAAKAAGMVAIGVLWGSHSESSLRQAPFDHLCESVEELTELLQNMINSVDVAPVAVMQEQ